MFFFLDDFTERESQWISWLVPATHCIHYAISLRWITDEEMKDLKRSKQLFEHLKPLWLIGNSIQILYR
jgi:hypothetical protein